MGAAGCPCTVRALPPASGSPRRLSLCVRASSFAGRARLLPRRRARRVHSALTAPGPHGCSRGPSADRLVLEASLPACRAISSPRPHRAVPLCVRVLISSPHKDIHDIRQGLQPCFALRGMSNYSHVRGAGVGVTVQPPAGVAEVGLAPEGDVGAKPCLGTAGRTRWRAPGLRTEESDSHARPVPLQPGSC